MTPERLVVGRVGRAHGLRGDVVIAPISNVPGRFDAGARLFLPDGTELEVVASRPHQGRPLVRFAGVEDRNAAEALRGNELLADPLGAPPEGEVWVHELVGCEVVQADGTAIGRCTAVIANPAHDLLELDSGALIPMVFVRSCETGRVVVELPEGLLDL